MQDDYLSYHYDSCCTSEQRRWEIVIYSSLFVLFLIALAAPQAVIGAAALAEGITALSDVGVVELAEGVLEGGADIISDFGSFALGSDVAILSDLDDFAPDVTSDITSVFEGLWWWSTYD